ncbi:MAG: helix-turn-helix domain-containing protein [Verrucomicrobiales bacterium]
MSREPKTFSVVPAGGAHRVVGERVVIHPGLDLEILTTRKIILQHWQLRGLSDPYWRLYLPVEGRALVDIQGQTTELSPGNAYLIPPRTTIHSRNPAPFTKWYVHFTLGRAGDRAAPGIYAQALDPRLKAMVRELATPSPTPFPWQTASLVIETLRRLPPEIWTERGLDSRIEAAMDFMYANLSRKLSSEDIARAAGMSVRNLNHLFHTQLDFTPMRQLLAFRLDQACRQLRHSDDSIDAIAEDCGFPNRYYFSRMLKRHRQSSPAAYRKAAGV